MENQEKILHLTKEESNLILIAIRQAYYKTGFVYEEQYIIEQHTLLFATNSTYIVNLYNKVAQFLGYETRFTEEE